MVKSYDNERLFSMYPNKTGAVVSEEYRISVKTNDYGYRQILDSDDEYPIAVLGDSFTEGWGVAESESFVTIANEGLNQQFKIRNLGIHGASPVFYLLQLPYVIENFSPKVIVLQLFDNDLDDNEKLARFMKFEDDFVKPKPDMSVILLGSSISNWIKESSLYRLVKKINFAIRKQPNPILYYKPGKEPHVDLITHEQSLIKYGKLAPIGNEISTKYSGQFEFYSEKNKELWQERLTKNGSYLNQILSLCKVNGIELRLLYVPAKEFYANTGILGDAKKRNYDDFAIRNPHLQQIDNFCKINKIVCYNTAKLLFDKDPESLYFPYDAHWNQAGHKMVGDILAKTIAPEI
ncbi:SGNH/GDSL hydrolase family protein [Leptospira sp. GIMC2001]|uniref:SGNH/GDSL hydrolase family protein n=1 Tax=Leptospira sp. GIMC2001 TaxID=1513297 RepID=UPI002349D198|nr:SGNH/GDSL hydrolase family protein [Leptospira sp. GIMC2001]WCL49595.1 SGNH/GDSL hydrolase family protein [Leptospira sp. GIMC2001]